MKPTTDRVPTKRIDNGMTGAKFIIAVSDWQFVNNNALIITRLSLRSHRMTELKGLQL
jgi:hypothetical protein